MVNVMDILPELEGKEAAHIQMILNSISPKKASQFAHVYRARRKKPQEILLFAVLGLFFIAGIHRFVLHQIGMGLLYLFTGGFCYVGTILDLINYQALAFEYNRGVADDIRVTMGI